MNNTENRSQSKIHALLLFTLLVLISLLVYWDFLTFTQLFLYKDIGSDTLNVFLPKYVHLADYLRTDGWPAWSFSQGMGQNIFPGSIGDPFELLLLLMGSEYLAYGLVYTQVLKILLTGIIFYNYLRVLSLEPMTATIGALFYAFSGFMILGGTWYIFSTDAVYFAFLLYAFERFLKDRVWIYFPIAVALVVAGMTFNLFLYAMFFLPYGLFRHYVCHGWQTKALSLFLLKLVGLAVLGLGISAVFLIANVQQMLNSPRVLGEVSLFDQLMSRSLLDFESFAHYITAVMRLFSSDLLGAGSKFGGWRNYLEAPIFYCGLLSLLLAPQVFVQLERKHKIAYALFGLVFLVPVVLPFFRYLFWAFSGNYYRLYSAFVALVILFFSLHALNFIFKTGKVHTRLLVATLVVLLAMLFSPYLFADVEMIRAIDSTMLMIITGLLLVYTLLVITLKTNRFRSLAQWGLLFVICLELAGFSWQTINDRSVLTTKEYMAKTGYNDYSNDAVAAIKQKDPGFYRIEKTYFSGPSEHTSFNDAKIQGYFGTSSYASFNQLNYIRFLDVLGIIDGNRESATRWAYGVVNNTLLASFSTVKYVFVKRAELVPKFGQFGYKRVHQEGDVIVLLNPYYLPFGFTYDSYMTEDEFMSVATPLKSTVLMKTAVLEERLDQTLSPTIKAFDQTRIESAYGEKSYRDDVRKRRTSALKISSYAHNHVKGKIELKQPKMLFFTLPFDRGWSVTVNGEHAELMRVNIGFSGLLLPAGQHEVELRYQLPYFTLSVLISVFSILCLILLVWRRGV